MRWAARNRVSSYDGGGDSRRWAAIKLDILFAFLSFSRTLVYIVIHQRRGVQTSGFCQLLHRLSYFSTMTVAVPEAAVGDGVAPDRERGLAVYGKKHALYVSCSSDGIATVAAERRCC